MGDGPLLHSTVPMPLKIAKTGNFMYLSTNRKESCARPCCEQQIQEKKQREPAFSIHRFHPEPWTKPNTYSEEPRCGVHICRSCTWEVEANSHHLHTVRMPGSHGTLPSPKQKGPHKTKHCRTIVSAPKTA